MVSLRRAAPEDLMFYFELRNDPSAKKLHFNTEPIDLATHKAWFASKFQDSNACLFVIEREGEKIGQVRIDLHGNAGEIDIALMSSWRGKGYAPGAIQQAVSLVFQERADIETISAYIKESNIASQKSFERAGFQPKGKTTFQGNECMLMTYEKREQSSGQLSEDVLEKAVSASDLQERLSSNARYSSQNLHEWIFKQFELAPNAVILELCCGTGTQTEIMSRLCPQGIVYASDVSRDAVSVLAAKNLPNVKPIVMDMESVSLLPLKENFFDIIFCSYGLYYSRDTRSLIQSLYPLLKEGGELIVVGPYGDNNQALWDLIEQAYPIDKDILFSTTDYMTVVVEETCKKLFKTIKKTYFENKVSYPTPESLFSYIAASTVFLKAHEQKLKEVINKAFVQNMPFRFIKKAMCLRAKK
ncbi:MAG: GNAT family N-acetyltransferase [Parcubacteria group bacterium]|nr:GNAT family N-acetyltransferase [Parcubacteria group bacterium]